MEAVGKFVFSRPEILHWSSRPQAVISFLSFSLRGISTLLHPILRSTLPPPPLPFSFLFTGPLWVSSSSFSFFLRPKTRFSLFFFSVRFLLGNSFQPLVLSYPFFRLFCKSIPKTSRLASTWRWNDQDFLLGKTGPCFFSFARSLYVLRSFVCCMWLTVVVSCVFRAHAATVHSSLAECPESPDSLHDDLSPQVITEEEESIHPEFEP